MTLRSRLTFLFISMIGGILLLFGVGVYAIVNWMLVNQVDQQLHQTAFNILDQAQIDSVGEIDVLYYPVVEMTRNAYIQVWDLGGNLQTASPSLIGYTNPLDELGLQSPQDIIREVTIEGINLRVLSVPFSVGQRPVGVLQVAHSMGLIEDMLRNLLYISIVIFFVSIAIAGLVSWQMVGSALEPLSESMGTARQITRADDLSRRIPYMGPEDDEIGLLIKAFNQTLELLETLFTSQQRFLADVSHELRTPLTVIKGNVDLMRRMKQLDNESLASIDHEANRLTRLVGDLLLLAQAETGRLPMHFSPFAVDELIFEVYKEMRILAGDKVALKLVEIDQVVINGDRDRLKQVLINLVSNAIQYTPAGGEVTLGLCKSLDFSKISVKDSGPGIPEKDLPHIFDRFYRTEKSRTRSKNSGFGLGLSIAYWISNHHGGRIEVESQEDQGATFHVFLPLLNEDAVVSENE